MSLLVDSLWGTCTFRSSVHFMANYIFAKTASFCSAGHNKFYMIVTLYNKNNFRKKTFTNNLQLLHFNEFIYDLWTTIFWHINQIAFLWITELLSNCVKISSQYNDAFQRYVWFAALYVHNKPTFKFHFTVYCIVIRWENDKTGNVWN